MSPIRRKSSRQPARGSSNVDSYIDRSTVGFEAGGLRGHTGLITDESFNARTNGRALEGDSGDIFLDESVDELEWEASAEKR